MRVQVVGEDNRAALGAPGAPRGLHRVHVRLRLPVELRGHVDGREEVDEVIHYKNMREYMSKFLTAKCKCRARRSGKRAKDGPHSALRNGGPLVEDPSSTRLVVRSSMLALRLLLVLVLVPTTSSTTTTTTTTTTPSLVPSSTLLGTLPSARSAEPKFLPPPCLQGGWVPALRTPPPGF